MPNPYCQKRRSSWYLRLRVPTDLRGVLGTHIIRSLGTGRAGEARALAAAMAARANLWWDVLRRSCMAHVLGKPIDQLTGADMRRENLAALGADFDRLDADGRRELYEKMKALLKTVFMERNAERENLQAAEIALEMMRDAARRGYARGLERAIELGGRQADARADAPSVEAPHLPAAQRPKNDPRATMRLQELAEAADGYFASAEIGPKGRGSYLHAFGQFEKMVGVRAVRNVTEDDLLAYRIKLEGQAGRDGRAKAARATVQKNLGHVKAILRWAYVPPQRLIANDPGRDIMGPKKPKAATMDGVRLAFGESELTTIFRSPLFTGCRRPFWHQPGPVVDREDRFYFFLAMYLTGARNMELPGAGIYDLSGIPCLDLRATATKTSAAPRIVPLLPELVRTGFLDWATARLKRRGKLFLGPTAPVKWGDFPSRYLRRIGVGDAVHTAYSLRHSHRQMLRGSGLSDELIDKSFGHEGIKVGSRYGSGVMTRQEAEAWLRAVKCSIDLSHLFVK